jgi:hypothetical protein
MKICEFDEWELMHAELPGVRQGLTLINPYMRATVVLSKALEIVNQAGLDGKKLTEMRVVHISDPSSGPGGGRWEVHAKVTHRLAKPIQV